MKLSILQLAPRLRDIRANAVEIARRAADAGADLVLTPELSLTGYDLGDDAPALALPVRPDGPLLPEFAGAPPVIVGLVERGEGGVVYNVAAHLREGAVHHRHRKVYLPTYGMFDEGRFFGRGDRIEAYTPIPGWRAGLLICEDFWHPGLIYLLAAQRIQLLLVQAAGPGRGAWPGGDAGGPFASADLWERIARATAQVYGIYVALANRVGVEGGVTFAGGSILVAPTGDVVARAPAAEEGVISATLSLEEVERARRPYFHGRDEDPHLLLRELTRVVSDGRR